MTGTVLDPQPLEEAEVNAILDAEISRCIGATLSGDKITEAREKGLAYYKNDPRGDETVGKSTQQSSDVQDVVEGLMPGALKPFISTGNVVEFLPNTEAGEEYAKQATDYINYVFMRENPGFRILYTWMKDAFIQRNSYVKAAWVTENEVITSEHDLDGDALTALQQFPGVEIVSVTPTLNGEALDGAPEAQAQAAMMQAQVMNHVKIRRTEKRGHIQIWNIAPEHVIISNDARGPAAEARLVGHVARKTVSQLLEGGFSREALDDVPVGLDIDFTHEAIIREQEQQGAGIRASGEMLDPSTRELWVGEYFMRMDVDGDGIAELRKITRAGESIAGGRGKILANEAVDACDIFDFTAIIMPHQHFGRSMADLTIPIQDTKTVLLRRWLDSIYRTVYPRMGVIQGGINDFTFPDLLADTPGGYVRMEKEGAVFPLISDFKGADVQAAIEYQDRVRETRTPVTRQMQGVDPNVLDQTATEATLTANAGEERRELILRVFADALGALMKHLLKLSVQHQDKPRTLKLRNKWVAINPADWDADMEVSVNVGLGTGSKEQRLQGVSSILAQQQQLKAEQSAVYSEAGRYKALSHLVELLGYASPENYFADPAAAQDPNNPAAQQAQAQQQEMLQQAQQQGYEQGMNDGKLQLGKAQLAADMQKHEDNKTMEAAKLQADAKKHADTMALAHRKQGEASHLAGVAQGVDIASRAHEQTQPAEPVGDEYAA